VPQTIAESFLTLSACFKGDLIRLIGSLTHTDFAWWVIVQTSS